MCLETGIKKIIIEKQRIERGWRMSERNERERQREAMENE